MTPDVRARLKDQASALLDCVTVKLMLTPIGVALDIDFLERVSLFVAAVESALSQDERDTVPPPGPRVRVLDGLCALPGARRVRKLRSPTEGLPVPLTPEERLAALMRHEWTYKEGWRRVVCMTCGREWPAAKFEATREHMLAHKEGCSYFALVLEAAADVP